MRNATASSTTIKRMMRFAAPVSGLLVLFLLVVVLDAGVTVTKPLLYRAIIDDGILRSDTNTVVWLAILIAVLGVVASCVGLAQSYISAKIGANIVFSLRMQLFERLQEMPLAFFTHVRTGALVTRIDSDVTGAQSAFTDVLSNVIGNIIAAAFVLTAMFALSWRMTAVALMLFPIFFLPSRPVGRRVRSLTRDNYDATAAMDSAVVERFSVAGVQLAKLFGTRERERQAFGARAARVSDLTVKYTVYRRLYYLGLVILAAAATAFAYGWGGVLAARHRLEVGTVVAFVSYLTALYNPLTVLSNAQVNITAALVSFERVFEILDLTPSIREKAKPIPLPAGHLQVSFRNVCFHYPLYAEHLVPSLAESRSSRERSTTAETILRDITFLAEPGQIVALVGPSGAGKTTITSLISRLYDVDSGSISVGGLDVREIALDALRKRIGIVTQDAHFFNDSIRANLAFAKPNASEHEMIDALGAAHVLSLIQSLPEGLDTPIGERGYRLSGGERQRLAIARVLLKNADIIILDEATAHLDCHTEAAIQQTLEVALRGRTCIVIAHRLSTIVKADVILVVKEGSVVERGTHERLLERRGAYWDLYQSQLITVQQ